MSEAVQVFGLSAIENMFEQAKAENRSAFMPYFPIGYPTYEKSMDAILAMADIGADGFEIGIPFSDPIADGPTVQAATQIALENGTTVKHCLEAVKILRERGVTQPMMLMGYVNPLLAYGVEQFVYDAQLAGADGLIIPDLPPEEAHWFTDTCAKHNLALIFLLAPTSNDKRIQLVAEKATGFIYVVSLTGITGARDSLPSYLQDYIGRLREQTTQPLVLGFGIGTPEHVKQINNLVDGFIVGSALVRAGKESTETVRMLSQAMRQVLDEL